MNRTERILNHNLRAAQQQERSKELKVAIKQLKK